MSKEKDKHFHDKLKKFFKHNRDGTHYKYVFSIYTFADVLNRCAVLLIQFGNLLKARVDN